MWSRNWGSVLALLLCVAIKKRWWLLLLYVNQEPADFCKLLRDFSHFDFISEPCSLYCLASLTHKAKPSQVPARVAWPCCVFLCCLCIWAGWLGVMRNICQQLVFIFLYQMSGSEMKLLFWTWYSACSFSNLPNLLASLGKWCFWRCHRCQTLIKSALSC